MVNVLVSRQDKSWEPVKGKWESSRFGDNVPGRIRVGVYWGLSYHANCYCLFMGGYFSRAPWIYGDDALRLSGPYDSLNTKEEVR